jgi:AraC-like DNA-binding protein
MQPGVPLEGGLVSAVIRRALEMAAERGRSCAALRATAAAWRASLDAPGSSIAASAHLQAFLCAWSPVPDAAFEAWRLARSIGLAQWGSLGYGVMTAPHVLAALEFDARWQTLACTGVSAVLHLPGVLQLDVGAQGAGLGAVFWGFVLGCRQVLIEGAGGLASDWQRVGMPCEPDAHLHAALRSAGVPVQFGAATYHERFVPVGLLRPNPCSSPMLHGWVSHLAAVPVSSPSPQLHHSMAGHALPGGAVTDTRLLEALRGWIRADLDAGRQPTLESIEPRLRGVLGFGGLGVRQLQRRLAAQQTGFRELVAEVRQARALEHLRHSSRPLADIAAEAGYAELSSFHRAVRRWTGGTPMAYRMGYEPVSPEGA